MSDNSAAIMGGVVDFFSTCAALDSSGTFSVDMLPEELLHYGFSYVPATRVVKRYIDGSTLQQFSFTLASNEVVDQATLLNLQNSAFYDELAEWVEDKNNARELPTLPTGMTARELRVTIPGHIESTNGKTARYAIQMQLTYHKEV